MKIAKEKAPDNRGFFLYNGIANRETIHPYWKPSAEELPPLEPPLFSASQRSEKMFYSV